MKASEVQPCLCLHHWVLLPVDPINYLLHQPGKHPEVQMYDVNVLKHCVEPSTALLSSLLSSVLGPAEPVEKSLELTPTQ